MNIPRLAGRSLRIEVPGRVLCSKLDFDVRPGECWAIVGPNGAGKTTLLATLAGLRSPAAGEVFYDGAALTTLGVRDRALRRAWLPQDSVDFFPATVLETVLVGRHPHLSRWQWESVSDIDCAQRALRDVGLAGLDQRSIGSLSGGERRRVALAALIAQDADLVLLDEPSSHLDLAQQIETLDVLVRLARDGGKALLMVLHDLHLALRYADHAIALANGHASAGLADDILSLDSLSALFGHRLLALGHGHVRTFVPA